MINETSLRSICEKLVKDHNLYVELLTEQQLAEAIRQAIDSGDFTRHIGVGGGQQVLYMPGFGMDSLQTKYNELIYAVERVYEGESRHETALRYIREAETRTSEPAMETKR